MVSWISFRFEIVIPTCDGLSWSYSCNKSIILTGRSRGYLNWTNLQEVIDLYAEAGIQLEGIMS